MCGYHPVQCPNECGELILRQNVDDHVESDCPQAIVVCDFHSVGCEKKVHRKRVEAHARGSLHPHLSLLLDSHRKQQNENKSLREEVTMLKKKLLDNSAQRENEALKHEVASLKRDYESLQMEISMLKNTLEQKIESLKQKVDDQNLLLQQTHSRIDLIPVDLIMENYKQYLINNVIWYSPPFYSQPRGYKLCLGVEKDAYLVYDRRQTVIHTLSVQVFLMRGEFDAQLEWPFEGKISVMLLSHQRLLNHHTKVIQFYSVTSTGYGQRVNESERADYGHGFRDYIKLSDLDPIFVKNNCLYFRILKIESPDKCGS